MRKLILLFLFLFMFSGISLACECKCECECKDEESSPDYFTSPYGNLTEWNLENVINLTDKDILILNNPENIWTIEIKPNEEKEAR